MKPSSKHIQDVWPLNNVSIVEILKESEKARTLIRINADEGDFVYRITAHTKSADALRKELLAFSFLPEHGFRALPKLVATRDGELFQTVDERHVYILEFVDGEHPKSDADTYASLGKLTAQLHSVEGYPYDTEFDADVIAKNHLKDRGAPFAFRDEFLRIAADLPEFNHFPRALIHTDVGPNNAIRSRDGSIYFIDWDDVGMGTALLDIGFPLIQQFIGEDLTFHEVEARAFYSAYFATISMSDEEKSAIFDAAVFIALDYIIYGESPERRFERVKWAIRNRARVESVYLS